MKIALSVFGGLVGFSVFVLACLAFPAMMGQLVDVALVVVLISVPAWIVITGVSRMVRRARGTL
jgi:hypothetical protein